MCQKRQIARTEFECGWEYICLQGAIVEMCLPLYCEESYQSLLRSESEWGCLACASDVLFIELDGVQ